LSIVKSAIVYGLSTIDLLTTDQKMKILDKYILKKILSTFFFVVLILVAIICIIDLTEKIDK
jgi:hypothetical protein